jgi:uncharacterized membrane protein YdjX (TVP38/TMEM64 family)
VERPEPFRTRRSARSGKAHTAPLPPAVDSPSPNSAPEPRPAAVKQNRAALLAVAALAGAGLAYALLPGFRAEANAALGLAARADIAPLRDYLLGFGWWAPVVSTALQVITSVIAPLPSFVLAFVNAMLFGLWWGGLLTWSTALLAAAICFGMSRALGRPVVERFVPRGALEGADRFFVRHGAWAVLVARLIPFVNPDVISYAAGLTPMRWRLFMASIAVGSVPSTLLYSYLGSRGVTSVGWLLVPLVVLGLLAFAGALLRRPGPQRTAST